MRRKTNLKSHAGLRVCPECNLPIPRSENLRHPISRQYVCHPCSDGVVKREMAKGFDRSKPMEVLIKKVECELIMPREIYKLCVGTNESFEERLERLSQVEEQLKRLSA